MATVTVLRPSSTLGGDGWSAVPSGTLHGVTSDDNDSTYALWGGVGSPLVLATPADAPPAGERRHLVRLRARGEDGDAFWAIRLTSGVLIAGASAQFSSSPGTVNGSWAAGAPVSGSTILTAYVDGQSTGLKIEELYLEVDTREAPDFTAQILDGSGTATTVVGDTAQPVVRPNALDLDGLTPRNYRYWVTLNGAIVWDTGYVSGAPVDRQTTALDNGTYVAHLQVWSRLGDGSAFPSAEKTVTFTVSVGQIERPGNPTVDPVDGTPFYSIEACAPLVNGLDGGVGYIEIQRVDCPVGGYLQMSPSAGAYASTPDPGPPVGTELEVQVKAQRFDDWRPSADEDLISHYDTTGFGRGWRLYIDSDGAGDPALIGRPVIGWSADGVTNLAGRATARPPIDPYGIVRLRLTWVLDDGNGAEQITFWSRVDDDAEWTQLGDVLEYDATTVHDNTGTPYAVGAVLVSGLPSERFNGRIYSAEVRSSIGGPIVVNPDFTGHLDGTTSFDDTAGNTWTVHSPAVIVNATSPLTITMLGPLATDECASYVDYALPRSGVGASCDHAPAQCCSYYRARTVGRVDGNLRISDWSDVFNPGLPAGLIVMWPSTAASVPSGWNRVTELDGKYAKGVATSSTQPGTTGGAASHTHTVATHTHDLSHSHTVTGATGVASGTQATQSGGSTLNAALSTHTHTRSAVGAQTVTSGSATPAIGSVVNDPAKLEVLYVESDGTPLGVPNSALAITADVSLSGWTDYANATNRFLKGAAAAGNGGATAASLLDSHTHTVGAHSHTAPSHFHTSPNTGATAQNASLFAGSAPVLWQSAAHSHPVTVGSTSAAPLDSGGSGSSGSTSPDDPPYRNVRVRQNTSGVPDLPVGLICAWRGSLGSIPDNWALCDGTGGTPDLTGRYPRGATSSLGTAGGSLNPHNHSTPAHTHSTAGHSHTETVGAATVATSNVINTSPTVTAVTGTHTHSAGNTDSTTPSVANTSSGTLSSVTTEPPFEEVAFVQMTSAPTPPPDPDTFCLVWTDEEHLIRSAGPSGELWAPIKGKFEWTVERPFTAAAGVNGSRFVTSASPGGRNLSMTAAVESEAELAQLQAVLDRPLVLISPSDSNELWAAPVASSVRIVKVGRIRQVTASFIATGPQPAPQLADVA